MKLERDADIWVLTLTDGENRLNPTSVAEWNTHLDAVEADPAPLVVVGEDKFWSNGLDLTWMLGNLADSGPMVATVHALLARLLTLPVPTVAALNGHTFAAGAMLAAACDVRVMRSDRGFWCLPEVDINIPFTPGMQALLTTKMPVPAILVSMSLGKRYTAAEALAAGFVSSVHAQDEVLPAASAVARSFVGKSPATLAAIKNGLYGTTAEILRTSPTPALPGA